MTVFMTMLQIMSHPFDGMSPDTVKIVYVMFYVK